MHCKYSNGCPCRTYKLRRSFVGAENSKIPKKVIQHHPFGIGTDIVLGISVPEGTAGTTDTEIPNFIRHSQLWVRDPLSWRFTEVDPPLPRERSFQMSVKFLTPVCA